VLVSDVLIISGAGVDVVVVVAVVTGGVEVVTVVVAVVVVVTVPGAQYNFQTPFTLT
jgi:hypothetical protein